MARVKKNPPLEQWKSVAPSWEVSDRGRVRRNGGVPYTPPGRVKIHGVRFAVSTLLKKAFAPPMASDEEWAPVQIDGKETDVRVSRAGRVQRSGGVPFVPAAGKIRIGGTRYGMKAVMEQAFAPQPAETVVEEVTDVANVATVEVIAATSATAKRQREQEPEPTQKRPKISEMPVEEKVQEKVGTRQQRAVLVRPVGSTVEKRWFPSAQTAANALGTEKIPMTMHGVRQACRLHEKWSHRVYTCGECECEWAPAPPRISLPGEEWKRVLTDQGIETEWEVSNLERLCPTWGTPFVPEDRIKIRNVRYSISTLKKRAFVAPLLPDETWRRIWCDDNTPSEYEVSSASRVRRNGGTPFEPSEDRLRIRGVRRALFVWKEEAFARNEPEPVPPSAQENHHSESWVPPPGVAAISTFGRYCTTTGIFRSGAPNPHGYPKFAFQKSSLHVASAVMAVHGPPRPSALHTIDHADGNRRNNALSNLRWATPTEQIENAMRLNPNMRKKRGQTLSRPVESRRKGTQEDVWQRHSSSEAAAAALHVDGGHIRRVCRSHALHPENAYYVGDYQVRWAPSDVPSVLPGEVWFPVVLPDGQRPPFRVSNLARVCRNGGVPTRGYISGREYKIGICGKKHRVHRLVCLARAAYENLPVPARNTVNHVNHDALDNKADNLEWATPGEQIRHSYTNPNRRTNAASLSVPIQGRRVAAPGEAEQEWVSYTSCSVAARRLTDFGITVSQPEISHVLYGRLRHTKGFEFRRDLAALVPRLEGEGWLPLTSEHVQQIRQWDKETKEAFRKQREEREQQKAAIRKRKSTSLSSDESSDSVPQTAPKKQRLVQIPTA